MDLGVNIGVVYDKTKNLTEWLFCSGYSQIVGVSHTGSGSNVMHDSMKDIYHKGSVTTAADNFCDINHNT